MIHFTPFYVGDLLQFKFVLFLCFLFAAASAFAAMPALEAFAYQCSPQSTPEGIRNTFENAVSFKFRLYYFLEKGSTPYTPIKFISGVKKKNTCRM